MRGDDLEAPRFGDHAQQPIGHALELQILRDAFAKRTRLADIERVALGIEHAIDAGAQRQRRQRRAQHPRPFGGDRRRFELQSVVVGRIFHGFFALASPAAAGKRMRAVALGTRACTWGRQCRFGWILLSTKSVDKQVQHNPLDFIRFFEF